MHRTKMPRIPPTWSSEPEEEGSLAPGSLFRLCLESVARNLDSACVPTADGLALRDGLTLPWPVCGQLIETYQNHVDEVSDRFAHLFKDVSRTCLTSVDIRYSTTITDAGLEYLLQHNLSRLTLSHCTNLTHKTYANIMRHASNLQSLTIGPHVQVKPFDKTARGSPTFDDAPVRINQTAPKLKRFVLRDNDSAGVDEMLNNIMNVYILDMSYCCDVGNLQYLVRLNHLHTLLLFNVPNLNKNNAISKICALRSLVVLDISQSDGQLTAYKNENTVLATLVNCLPKLMSLDISGTNLAGRGTAESLTGNKKSDIPGLESRTENPLNFLGLYDTMYNACMRQKIPAQIITGNANLEQLVNAATTYVDKPELLSDILIDITFMFTTEPLKPSQFMYDIVLKIIATHINNEAIQKFGTEAIRRILNREENPSLLNNAVKKRIISTFLTIIEYYKDSQFMFSICSTFLRFNVPKDFIFDLKRYIQMLLHIGSGKLNAEIQVGAYRLLHITAHHLNYKQNIEFGKAGFIKNIMSLIKYRLKQRVFDDVFKMAWLTVLRVTYREPNNFKLFLDEDGIKCLIICLITLTQNHALSTLVTNILIKNMMDYLRNVSEKEELRPRLMQNQLIKLLFNLLFPMPNGFSVNYNAASIVANLASDGPNTWTVQTVSRNYMLDRMTKLIQTWDPFIPYDIEHIFESLDSILKFAQVKYPPQCIHLSLWNLANLTRIFPTKYCPMLIAKNVLITLNDLCKELNQRILAGEIEYLAKAVISQCQDFSTHAVELQF